MLDPAVADTEMLGIAEIPSFSFTLFCNMLLEMM